MKPRAFALLAALTSSALGQPGSSGQEIPEPLKPWVPWVLEGHEQMLAPPRYDDAKARPALWPARLKLEAGPAGAQFAMEVEVFAETWVPLPSGEGAWPAGVRAGAKPVPVLERDGAPVVRLPPGRARIEGALTWKERPPRLRIPQSLGLLELVVDGRSVPVPAWDAQGWLWLAGAPAVETPAEKDFLQVELHGALEDGNPLWLKVEVVLFVAGSPREETPGRVLPKGWKLASLESPIPAAVDPAGMLKVRARPGRWRIQLSAFRLDNPPELKFVGGAAAPEMLIGLRQEPGFRVLEIEGAVPVDASQTTYPERWRDLSVFRWPLAEPLKLVERMRGEGNRAPPGLHISRRWWLDQDGRGITVQDAIRGERQSLWRLDASPGLEPGSVRSAGEGQLITRNPETGAPGFEVRSRSLDIQAVGRMPAGRALPASGWQAPADSLDITLQLPPGWRLLAAGGADWVRGSWLHTWTLLDLFVLLMITLAVQRLVGWGAAATAFAGLALAFHEPGAPRFLWFAVLVPVALLRVVPTGRARDALVWLKWAAVVVLGLALTPFAASQIQQALYPQLEHPGRTAQGFVRADDMPGEAPAGAAIGPEPGRYSMVAPEDSSALEKSVLKSPRERHQNLSQEAGARIQTGPGLPEWSWRQVSFGWSGPVDPGQTVRPWLIPAWLERILSALRVVLVIALAVKLARAGRSGGQKSASPPLPPTAAAAALAALALAVAGPARAEFPSQEMLQELRERLLKAPEVFPGAAEIPQAALRIEGRAVTICATLDVAARCAVPIPGGLAGWAPLSVELNGQPSPALRREAGSLWVLVEPGVHTLRVSGLLAEINQWEWPMRLRPRQLTVEAPGWQVQGIRPDSTPEDRVFLTREQEVKTDDSGSFARQELFPAAVVERHLELGLRWQVKTTVRRLSPPGRAFSLRIPLLDGENVLSAGAAVVAGAVEARFGPGDDTVSWTGELPQVPEIALRTRAADAWAEKWSLSVSPVWNVAFEGLAPVFDAQTAELLPIWRPWPGERVSVRVTRPQAIPGPTTTIRRVALEVSAGRRQTASTMRLAIESTLGGDFPVVLPEGAEITAAERGGRELPVRTAEGALIIPLVPGAQDVKVEWRQPSPGGIETRLPAVRLPQESSNLSFSLRMPENRWILWTAGPVRGPAVRFWAVLALTITAAWVLSRARSTPLGLGAWIILGLGLSQVHFLAAAVVAAWFLILGLKGRGGWQRLPPWLYNTGQIGLVILTLGAAGVLFAVVAAGLLGDPRMFIAGNGSTPSLLKWFEDLSGPELPRPAAWSVSIWWYRLAMLAWALWLAFSVLRWTRWAWSQFTLGGGFRRPRPRAIAPPQPPPLD